MAINKFQSLGPSYWSPINILKHSFLTNHWPNLTQICEDSLCTWTERNKE